MINKQLERQVTSEQASSLIISEIANGSLVPGDKLPPLRDFAKSLGISVSTLREAYKILEARNIVESYHGKGVYVCSEPGLIEEPFGFDLIGHPQPLLMSLEARLAFEPFGAYLAAKRASQEDIERLGCLVNEMVQCFSEGKSITKLDMTFHATVIKISQNPFLVRIWEAVTSYYRSTAEHRHLARKVPNQIEKAVQFHTDIFEAIRNRDSVSARKVMEEHLQDSFYDYRDLLQSQKSDE